MGTYQVGEVGWEDVNITTGQGGSGGNLFVSMKEPGSYRIRITSKPYQYYHHWVEDKAGNRIKVNSALDNCPITQETGQAPKVKWMIRVLQKEQDGTLVGVRVLDAGPQIMGQLRALNDDPNWGKLTDYDVTIVKGKKGANPLYKVNPISKTNFTEEEKDLLRQAKDPQSKIFIDLAKLTEPWEPEKILERINGKKPQSSTPAQQQQYQAPASQANKEEDFLDL